MNLTKDTYEYLLNFANDREIIIMLSLNKKFNDEKLFEKVMRQRYPRLIKYRKSGETWKGLCKNGLLYFENKRTIPYSLYRCGRI